MVVGCKVAEIDQNWTYGEEQI